MAGEEINAIMDARDRYGNATTWSGESATVVAHGPAHSPADRAFDVVDARGGRIALRGLLPRAGSYTVAVAVDGTAEHLLIATSASPTQFEPSFPE